MEKKSPGRLKELLLLGFVLASLVLIAGIWADSLLDRGSQTPGFYRPTVQVEEGFFLTQTAAVELGTLQPTREHKNDHSTPTPPITGTLTPTPTEEVDQVN